MQSQNFLTKLSDTRTSIQSLVSAIIASYYDRDTTDALLANNRRFQRPADSSTLVTPIRLIPDNGTATCTYALPANPVDGDEVEWRASGTPFSTNALVFVRNGKTILGQAQNLTIDADGNCGRLVWDAVEGTWMVDILGTTLETGV